jgi:hypothetical protein
LVVDVHTCIRADESWLAVFVNRDLTQGRKARIEEKKGEDKRENSGKTLRFSDQFSTRVMGKKTGRIDFPTRETLARI